MKNIPLYDVRKIKDLRDMLNSSVEIYGDKPAFLVKYKSGGNYEPVSYKQFKRDVESFGTALSSLGLKGGKIAVIGENRYEWALTYLATVNGTGIIVPLDKDLPENEIENLLVRSEANAIIYSGHIKEHINNISARLNSVSFYIDMDASEDDGNRLSFKKQVEKGASLLDNGDRSFLDAEINTEVMNMLLFTSATTDKSKAVMLSHKNICINLMSMSSMLYIDPSDIFLSVLPLHHTYECTCGFLCPIYRGATVAYCEGLRHIQKNLQEAKATVLLAVPLILESIYKRIWDQAAKKPGLVKKMKSAIEISNLLRKLGIDMTRKLFAQFYDNFGGKIRLFISGAAGIDPIIAKGFRDFGLICVQGYGLTECSPIVALNRDVDFKDNAAGLPLPGLQIRIENPGADGVGEIVVKGESVMLGYHKDKVSTDKVFKDGWFFTGDLGYMDADGFVCITGRKKNVIVTKNGKNIYPEEIETILNRSPYIKECMVFGKDDDVYGDVVISASIVPDTEKIEEDFKDKPLTKEEIYELIHKEVKAVNKTLVTYKYVKDFNLREEEFAKTTTKKIKRYMENPNQH